MTVWVLYFLIGLVGPWIICLAVLRSDWPSRASKQVNTSPEYAARRYWEGIARKNPRRAQARYWARVWETELGRPLDSKPRRRTGRRHEASRGQIGQHAGHRVPERADVNQGNRLGVQAELPRSGVSW